MYNAQESFTSRSLNTFYEAFLDCALWSSTDDNGKPLEDTYEACDIDLVCRDRLKLECQDFYDAHYDDLSLHGSWEQGGHDFWLTRCGHGTGFWDRGTGEVGDRLTAAAKIWGSVDFYVGDDGKLYI
jgi:hypothetical protein